MDNRSPIRVLNISHRLASGGAEAMIMNVYRKIDRQLVQFDFAVRDGGPYFYEEEARDLGARIFRIPWGKQGNPANIFSFNRKLASVMNQHGPFAAAHSHAIFYSGFYLPVAAYAGIPIRIAHSHSTSYGKAGIIYRVWDNLMQQSIKYYATHWLACSVQAGQWLFGKNAENDPRFILSKNGIDLNLYASLPTRKNLLRQKLKLPEQGVLIGHIGRFEEGKNQAFLIDIFQEFLTSNPTAHLILVGEGGLQKQIKAIVEQKNIEGHVHFLGARRDIPEILGAIDCFVLPSLFEGLGIVLVEAQAAGVPCLSSDVIPSEADLKIGLLEKCSLNDGANIWSGKLQSVLGINIPTWDNRKLALINSGYDINMTAQLWQSIYLGHSL